MAQTDPGLPRTKPFPPWPYFGEEEAAAAASVIRSGRVNYWTGDQGRAFEKEFAFWSGAAHAIAVANGTASLELALRALGVGPGDEVITTSRTFIASASAAVMVGATPVVADVDRDSQNVTAETLNAVLTPQTRALIVVHLAGWPCDMDPIMELARNNDLFVIEDCAQAIGATYRGRMVGTIGHVGSFSFCQDKIITTAGEGGMVTTNDTALFKRMWALKDHGKDYDAVFHREHPPGFRWLHESFGTNWRMTEVQSAVGRLELAKLPNYLEIRRRNAAILDEMLGGLEGLRIPKHPADVVHARYKYYAFVRPQRLAPGWDRDRIQEAVGDLGIPIRVGSCSEIYQEKAFQNAGLHPTERLPVARELGETSLMLMVHPTLTPDDMKDMGRALVQVMQEATA